MSLVAHGITRILALELADRNYRSPLYMRTKPNAACSEENIIKDLGSLFFTGIASVDMKPIPEKNKKGKPTSTKQSLPHSSIRLFFTPTIYNLHPFQESVTMKVRGLYIILGGFALFHFSVIFSKTLFTS